MKNNGKIIKVIVIRESIFGSWIKDATTFGWLLLGQYANYKFTGNSWIITLMLSICLFAFVLTKAKTEELSPDEAIEKIKSMRPDNATV